MENLQQFQYMFLSRLKSDCEYFLGYGNKSKKVLYYCDISKHIKEMKKLYDQLIIKPEWLTFQEILNYENKMCL